LVSIGIFSAESKGRRAAGSEATPVLREKTLEASETESQRNFLAGEIDSLFP